MRERERVGFANERMTYVFFFGFLCLTALMAAFVGQLVRPARRTKTILVSAAAPSALLVIVGLALAAGESDLGLAQIVVTTGFMFLIFMFTGLVGAIIGSELASLARWLLRSRTEP